MNEQAQAAVVIVQGDARARRRLAHAVARGVTQIVECTTGEEALAAAAARRPAAVILDAVLPDVDGLTLCRELRERHGEDVPLIIVSRTRVSAHDRVAGLLVGADDYLVEPIHPDELLVRLRRLLRRAPGSTPAPAVADHGLSPRELQVLRLLSSGRSTPEIAAELVISRKTVSSHVQHVLAKLSVHSRAQAVAEAYRLGLAADVAQPRDES